MAHAALVACLGFVIAANGVSALQNHRHPKPRASTVLKETDGCQSVHQLWEDGLTINRTVQGDLPSRRNREFSDVAVQKNPEDYQSPTKHPATERHGPGHGQSSEQRVYLRIQYPATSQLRPHPAPNGKNRRRLSAKACPVKAAMN